MDNEVCIRCLEDNKNLFVRGSEECKGEALELYNQYISAIDYAIKAVKAVNLLDDLLVIESDGIYRPIKNTTKEECYKAIYEMSKIMADMREADNGNVF